MDQSSKVSFYCVIAILLSILYESQCEITRPCPKKNLACIKNYFVTHGHCRLPDEEMPEAVTRPGILRVPLPNVNTTCFFNPLIVRNFDGKILDFHINRETNNAVLTVLFPKVRFDCPKVTFLFNRVGLEPVCVSDYGTVNLTQPIATATIPGVYNLQMKQAYIASYSEEPYPKFRIGPKVLNSTSPLIQKYSQSVFSDIPMDLLHILDGFIPFTLQMFVKYKICDFDFYSDLFNDYDTIF